MRSSKEQPTGNALPPASVGQPDWRDLEDRSHLEESGGGADLALVRQAREGDEAAFIDQIQH